MGAGDGVAKLDRMVQLTGFSDPVYAEAYVTTHQYDIVLDVTVANRTADTLQNLCLELATMGDLKLVERPQNCTFAPYEQRHGRANIKVSSTETGVIFGNIVYESSTGDRSVVVLNDIHIDIMDYITPAECADVSFRNMWAEFEWENKVAINTSLTRCREFLSHRREHEHEVPDPALRPGGRLRLPGGQPLREELLRGGRPGERQCGGAPGRPSRRLR